MKDSWSCEVCVSSAKCCHVRWYGHGNMLQWSACPAWSDLWTQVGEVAIPNCWTPRNWQIDLDFDKSQECHQPIKNQSWIVPKAVWYQHWTWDALSHFHRAPNRQVGCGAKIFRCFRSGNLVLWVRTQEKSAAVATGNSKKTVQTVATKSESRWSSGFTFERWFQPQPSQS